MVSTINMVAFAGKICCLLIFSSNQVSTSDYTGLLSRLYKKASESNRPLVVIFDKNFLQSNRPLKKLAPSDNIGKEIISKSHKDIDGSLNRSPDKKLSPKIHPTDYKRYKINSNLEQYRGLLDMPLKKKRQQKKSRGVLRSPVIKKLLRISNNLRCRAKNECEYECSAKYKGSKQDKCYDTCEVNFECKPLVEESDSCGDECEETEDECEGNKCQGSTKGWAVTDPPARCPQC